MTQPEVTIIILNFNTPEFTLRAVNSCLENCYTSSRIVVVDNHSSDDSVSFLKSQFKSENRVQVLARSENDGFAAGNNSALSKALTPFVMLLNSDAYLDAASDLGILVKYMQSNVDVGMVTPHVLLGNGQTDPASHRGFPTPWNALSYYLGLEKLFSSTKLFSGYHEGWKDLTQIHEVSACTGAAVLVRSSAIAKVGLLDELFFMYGEDLDWCYRFKEAGFKVIFHPDVIVHHDKHTSGMKKLKHDSSGISSRAIQKRSREAFYEAMKLFYKKHYAHVYPRFVQSLTFLGIDLVRKLKGH